MTHEHARELLSMLIEIMANDKYPILAHKKGHWLIRTSYMFVDNVELGACIEEAYTIWEAYREHTD